MDQGTGESINLYPWMDGWKKKNNYLVHRDTPVSEWLAKHPRWSMGGITVSPVSNTNHQTKGLHALIITDQLSCPLELQKKSVSTLRVSLPLTIVVHEKVSLTCSLRWVWAHYMQQIPFTSNSFQIVSLEFNFWPSNQNHSRMIRLWFSLAEQNCLGFWSI